MLRVCLALAFLVGMGGSFFAGQHLGHSVGWKDAWDAVRSQTQEANELRHRVAELEKQLKKFEPMPP